MVYIIIHSNSEIREKSLLEVISKNLGEKIKEIDEICCDPDFCLIKKEEKGNIKIEQIKKLQKNLRYTPMNKNYQFGLIQDAHFMTPEAQNALLKTLEECHENTIIMLTVKNEDSILQTILSRCTRVYPNGENSQKETNIQDLFNVEEFLQKPIYEQIDKVEEISKDNQTKNFLESLTHFFRKEYSKNLKLGLGQQEKRILKMLTQAEYRITKNANIKITLEYICFKINDIWYINKKHQQNHPKRNFS